MSMSEIYFTSAKAQRKLALDCRRTALKYESQGLRGYAASWWKKHREYWGKSKRCLRDAIAERARERHWGEAS